MDAKKFLQQAGCIEQRIDALLMESYRLRSLAERATQAFRGEASSRSGVSHRIENAVLQLDLLEEQVITEITELVRVKREIQTVIQRVGNPVEKELLILHYIGGKPFEEIAEQMNYSWRHIRRLHQKALGSVEQARKPSAPTGDKCA
jgi:Sigma-70, region 4.